MLYTKAGDEGKTTLYHCNQKLSKSSKVIEALGALDEVNSFLGVIKIKVIQGETLKRKKGLSLDYHKILHQIQENLFIVQAEVAGAEKRLPASKVNQAEKIIAGIEKEIPPIKTFTISGATEISALLDFARTLARRAERRVIAVAEEEVVKISRQTLSYLNRLSSLLFALSRQSAYKSGINEQSPDYK